MRSVSQCGHQTLFEFAIDFLCSDDFTKPFQNIFLWKNGLKNGNFSSFYVMKICLWRKVGGSKKYQSMLKYIKYNEWSPMLGV